MPADPHGRSEATEWLFAALNSVEMASLPWSIFKFAGDTGDTPGWKSLNEFLNGRLGRLEPVSDGLVLAAVERAERHREREREGVMLSDIAEHLGFVHGSWTTRRLRPQLDALIAEGSLARSRRHGVVVWALTEAGRGQLERMRRAGRRGVWRWPKPD